MLLAACAAAIVIAPSALAQPDYPLVSALVPVYQENNYAFDLVIQSWWPDVAAAKKADPRALWFMLGMGGATYGSEVSSLPGFNKTRCMLRHADGSGWVGVQPFNMTLPDCDDAIADGVAANARAQGLYV